MNKRHLRHLLRAIPAALLAASLIACSADVDEPAKNGTPEETVTLSLDIADGNPKTIMPDDIPTVAPGTWLISATGPGGALLTRGYGADSDGQMEVVPMKDPLDGDSERQWFRTATGKSLTVRGIPQGTWDFHVVSYRDGVGGGARIAKGETRKLISAEDNAVTLVLDRLVRGDEGGTLPAGQTANIRLTWDKDRVQNPKLAVKTRYLGDGTSGSAATEFSSWLDMTIDDEQNTGSYEFTTSPLPAGSYTVIASVQEQQEDESWKTVAGTADILRVVETKPTSGVIPLTIGYVSPEYSKAVSFTLTDNTMAPIEGTIEISRNGTSGKGIWYPTEDSFNTLVERGIVTIDEGKTYGTMTKDELDDAIDSAVWNGKLALSWMLNGEKVPASANEVSWTIAVGEYPLQVTVSNNLLGAIGATSTTLHYEVLGFQWPWENGKEIAEEAATKAFVGYTKDAGKTLADTTFVGFPYVGEWDDLVPVYADLDDGNLFQAKDADTPVFSNGALASKYLRKIPWYLALPETVTSIDLSGLNVKELHLPATVKTITRLEGNVKKVNLENVTSASVLRLSDVKEVNLPNLVSTTDSPVQLSTSHATHITLGENVKGITRMTFANGYSYGISSDDWCIVEAPGLEYAGNGVFEKFKGIIDAPNLNNVGSPGFTDIETTELDFPNLTETSACLFYGLTASRLSLPNLTAGYLLNVSYNSKKNKVDKIELPKLRKLTGDSFRLLETGKLELPELEDIESNNVYLFQGCTIDDLSLPKLKRLGYYAFSATTFTDSNDTDTVVPCRIGRLSMPALETINGSWSSVTETSSITNSSFGGAVIGELSMPKLTSINGSIFYHLDTDVLDLPGLKEVSAYSRFLEGSTISELNMPVLQSFKGDKCFGDMPNLKDIYLPETLRYLRNRLDGYYVFSDGLTEDQTIHVPFAEGKLPSGWKNWLDPECKAKVVYGGIDGSKL